ncbi:MAG: trehalose-phosphatase [Actinomycetota bacterium]
MTTTATSVIEAFAAARRPAVITDFDGTLSHIVEDPAAATPVAGAVESLSALAVDGCQVVVLSGRPVDFLAGALVGLDPAVRLVGHSGLEAMENGAARLDEAVVGWMPVVRDSLEVVRSTMPDGVDLEDKGISFVLHYRRVPEREPAALEIAARVAADSGLSMKPGRMHVELRPPVAVDKGTAVRRALDPEADVVLFAGDDLVDLPGFDAVRQLPQTGVCVVVGSDELPAELADVANLTVGSPDELVKLLMSLRRSTDL